MKAKIKKGRRKGERKGKKGGLITVCCESSDARGRHVSSPLSCRLSFVGSGFLDIFMDLGCLAWGFWVSFQSF